MIPRTLVAALAIAWALPLPVRAVQTHPSSVGPQNAAPAFAGYWLGTLAVRARELRLLIHVTNDPAPAATLVSIDQGNEPRPMQMSVDGRRLTLSAPGGTIRVTATLAASGATLDAIFEQGGASFPIVFARVDGPPQLHRPQHPAPPFPYDAIDVTVDGPVALAGTLTKPRGGGPFPAVLLISGSGPQDRDHSFFGHKPFLVLADHLTRRGFAVLRVDDRGAGKSSGSRALSTIDDYAADALTGVRWLAAHADVDARRVGLIGHSEGGVVAPLVAARSGAVAFMVLLAAPVMDGSSLAMLQAERIARAAGANADQLALQQALNRRIFDVLAREADESNARAAVRRILEDELGQLGVTSAETIAAVEKQMEPQIRRGLSPWFRHFLTHDPRPALRAAKIPTLALFGSLDVQVPADANAPLMRETLGGSSSQSEVMTLPGLNHLFQTARTGAMDEYGRIEETFAPAALDAIAAWLEKVSGG